MIALGVSYLSGGIWIKTSLWNNNLDRQSPCAMLFDTGAAMTTIDVFIANRAGISLRNSKQYTVHGAGGSLKAHCVVAKGLWLGGVYLGAVAMNVIAFNKDSEVQAVLGMNVIKEFKVTIDLLAKSDDNDGIVLMEPAFDITDICTFDNFVLDQSRFGIFQLS